MPIRVRLWSRLKQPFALPVTERANNMAVGGWQGASGGGISGLDLMTPFTREFWNFKGRKRRARTLEVLKAYGDSITVLEQQ